MSQVSYEPGPPTKLPFVCAVSPGSTEKLCCKLLKRGDYYTVWLDITDSTMIMTQVEDYYRNTVAVQDQRELHWTSALDVVSLQSLSNVLSQQHKSHLKKESVSHLASLVEPRHYQKEVAAVVSCLCIWGLTQSDETTTILKVVSFKTNMNMGEKARSSKKREKVTLAKLTQRHSSEEKPLCNLGLWWVHVTPAA